MNINTQALVPHGTIWHQNSCAYDAVLSIIHAIWNSDRANYTQIVKSMNDDISGNLVTNFEKHASGSRSLESARDDLRHYLHHLSPRQFTWGQFTSAASILQYILSTPSITIQTIQLCKNNHVEENRVSNNTCYLMSATKNHADIASWMHDLRDETSRTCLACPEKMAQIHQITYPLPLIALEFQDFNIPISYDFNISISNSNILYKLRGIIYFGDSHFTSHIIYDNGMVWFHDGIDTGQTLKYEGMIHNLQGTLNTCGNKKVSVAVYAKC
jgi:hypothetical protein